MRYKWSKFNLIFTSTKHGYFIYNSRTNSFYKLTEDLYNKLLAVNNCNDDAISLLNDELLTSLIASKIIVKEGDDYLYATKMEYLKRKNSFTGNELSLIIVPTMACNFKCPYCYEHELPNSKMLSDVQDAVVDFINSYQKRCTGLSLSWHGGEPLIAFEEMQQLLHKIETKSTLPIIEQSMVSNGFLFDDEVCDFFSKHQLNYVQITVDGKEKTHNKNRIHKRGLPTYRKIIENIDNILTKLPETSVGVRMNIHNDNKYEYFEHFKYLSNRWKNKNATAYPAFVLPQGGMCSTSCLSPNQKAQFYIDLYDCGMNVNFTPQMQLGTCSALYETSFVIDSNGFLYKCWADIGIKSRSIGDVFSGINKWDFVAAYSIGSDKFTDNKCKECKIFPICDGGCNRFRTDYHLMGNDYDICQLDEQGMQKYLEIIYEQQQNAKQP